MNEKYRKTIDHLHLAFFLGAVFFYFVETSHGWFSFFVMGFMQVNGLQMGLQWLDKHPYNTTEMWKEANNFVERSQAQLNSINEIVKQQKTDSQDLLEGVRTVSEMEKAFEVLCRELNRIRDDPKCSYDCDLQRELVTKAIGVFTNRVHEISEF